MNSSKIKKIEKITDYKGKVYDLNVDQDHSYIVTKNKYISHNSAVEYIPSIVIEITKGKQILDDNDNPVGVHSTIRVKKTRLHIPFVKAELAIYFNKGFESTSGLFGVLEKTGIVKKVSTAGWWSFYNDETKRYRETEMMKMILENPDEYLKKLDTKIEVSTTEITIEDKNEE